MNQITTQKSTGRGRWKCLLPPFFLFLFSLAALMKLPRENYLFPRPLNFRSRYESFYNRDLPYVTVTVPELSWTGFACSDDGQINGYYYYTLYDGFCQFYLFPGDNETPAAPRLNDVSLKGRLIRLEDEEYRQLLTQMAEELPWTISDLEQRTAPYAVSTQPHPMVTRRLARIFFFGCLLFSLYDFHRVGFLYRTKHSKTEI